jgi:hypothetical protein
MLTWVFFFSRKKRGQVMSFDKNTYVAFTQQETAASPTAPRFPNSQDLSYWRRNSFPTGKFRCWERNLRQQPKIK